MVGNRFAVNALFSIYGSLYVGAIPKMVHWYWIIHLNILHICNEFWLSLQKPILFKYSKSLLKASNTMEKARIKRWKSKVNQNINLNSFQFLIKSSLNILKANRQFHNWLIFSANNKLLLIFSIESVYQIFNIFLRSFWIKGWKR